VSKWKRWHDFIEVAAILQEAGIDIRALPDLFSQNGSRKLNHALNNNPRIVKRKPGSAQSSPAWYTLKVPRWPQ